MTERQCRQVLWALFIGAILFRLPALFGALWFDEIWLLSDVGSQTLGETLTTFKSDNNHPLYSILSWFPVHTFGADPWSLRLFALVFGALSVVSAYRLSAVFLPQRVALLLSACLMVSSHHIAFSTNARGYTALLFFVLEACFWFHRALHDDGRRAWQRCALALALASFVHMTGVFLALGLLIAVLMERRRALLRIFAMAGALSLLMHAVLLTQMIAFFRRDRPEIAASASWTDPLWVLGEIFQSLGVGWAAGLIVFSIGLGIAVLGCRSLWQEHRWLVLTAVFSPALLFCVLVGMGRNLWPRLFFCFAGLALIIAIRGCSTLLSQLPRWSRLTLSMGLLLVCAWGTPKVWTVPAQDYPAAAEVAMDLATEGDIVVTVGLAGFPYEKVYPQSFTQIVGLAELKALREQPGRLLVLYTFPVHLQSRYPEIWQLLDTEGVERARTFARIHGGALVLIEL